MPVISLLICGFAQGQPRLFAVPAGADPANYPSGTTMIPAVAGNPLPICVDFWMTGEPTEIIATNLIIEEPFPGGTSGSLFVQEGSETIDTSHPQYVGNIFPSGSSAVPGACCCGVSACLCPPPPGTCDPPNRYRAGFAVFPNVLETGFVPTTSSYLGSLCYESTPDATGTFTVDWSVPGSATKIVGPDQLPLQNLIYDSHQIVLNPCVSNADCEDGDLCTQDACISGACTFPVGLFGDVNQSGAINIFDLFCILDGLNNDFSTCPLEDMDIAPCEGDGVVTVFDLFAMLDALGGIDLCCGP